MWFLRPLELVTPADVLLPFVCSLSSCDQFFFLVIAFLFYFAFFSSTLSISFISYSLSPGANEDQIRGVKIFQILLIYIFFIKEYNYYVVFILILHGKALVNKKKSAEKVKRGEKMKDSERKLILQLDFS